MMKKIQPSKLAEITDRILENVRLWECKETQDGKSFYVLARNRSAIENQFRGSQNIVDPMYWIIQDLGIPSKAIRHNSLTILM